MRTIRVTGKAQLKLKPDTTRITVTLVREIISFLEVIFHGNHNQSLLHGYKR